MSDKILYKWMVFKEAIKFDEGHTTTFVQTQDTAALVSKVEKIERRDGDVFVYRRNPRKQDDIQVSETGWHNVASACRIVHQVEGKASLKVAG
jgi:hypothetical protein